MYVCVCVSLSVRRDISGTTRTTFTYFCACCQWPWLGLPLAGWRNPTVRDNFWGFLFHWQCIVQHSIWDPYKKRLNRSRYRLGWWVEQCVTWEWRSPKGNPFSGVHTTGADARLQALNKSYRPLRRGGVAERGRSLISTIALLALCSRIMQVFPFFNVYIKRFLFPSYLFVVYLCN